MRRLTLKSFLLGLSFVSLAGCASSGGAGSGTGSLDKESIRNVVRARTNAYMACYEGTIDVRPGAIGKVVTTWDIGSDGRVSNVKFAEVDPTIVDIKPCLEREILALKFSPSGSNEPVEVRYPFYFDERQSMTIDR
ncbi:MAG: AgmX/PglI C-terminal domain-containing protein, partial [Proteobacteria bacterium]